MSEAVRATANAKITERITVKVGEKKEGRGSSLLKRATKLSIFVMFRLI